MNAPLTAALFPMQAGRWSDSHENRRKHRGTQMIEKIGRIWLQAGTPGFAAEPGETIIVRKV